MSDQKTFLARTWAESEFYRDRPPSDQTCFGNLVGARDRRNGFSADGGENDAYHEPVPIVQVWSSYAKLSEQGWTQEKIGKAVGVKQSLVSKRLKLHRLSGDIKNFIHQEKIDEAHLIEITQLFIDEYFSDWLTTQKAWLELAQKAVKDKSKNGNAILCNEDRSKGREDDVFDLAELCWKLARDGWTGERIAGELGWSTKQQVNLYTNVRRGLHLNAWNLARYLSTRKSILLTEQEKNVVDAKSTIVDWRESHFRSLLSHLSLNGQRDNAIMRGQLQVIRAETKNSFRIFRNRSKND